MNEFRDLMSENLNEANILLCGVPFDENASVGKGAKLAPKVLRELSYDLPAFTKEGFSLEKTKIYDFGDFFVKKENFFELENHFDKFFNAKEEAFSLILGGDHSISIFSERSFYKRAIKHNKIPVIIHLDAHPDICDVYDGSKYSHACTNFRSLEYGYKDENMVLACIRGFEKQEVEFLKNHTKIDVFKAKDIQLLGAKNFVNLMKNKFLDEKYEIYLSYDIDANDPAYAPGTGTPEAFGLTSLTILEIVTGLIKELNVRALDIVEVAPPLDVNNITSWLALKTIYEVFYTLQNKNI